MSRTDATTFAQGVFETIYLGIALLYLYAKLRVLLFERRILLRQREVLRSERRDLLVKLGELDAEVGVYRNAAEKVEDAHFGYVILPVPKRVVGA